MRIYESLRRGGEGRSRGAESTRVVVVGFVVGACLAGIAPTATADNASVGSPLTHVRLLLRSPVIDLFQSASVSVSGITAQRAEVRLLGATDTSGFTSEGTSYRWQRLRPLHGTWRGVLPAPVLYGIYRLQLRLDHGRIKLSSDSWLLRVFPGGTLNRRSFPTPPAAVRDFVTHLPGDKTIVALREWPMATFDHRDPRLHRLFVVAYAQRGDNRVSSRVGLFITTVRDNYQGRWRVLTATIEPYD